MCFRWVEKTLGPAVAEPEQQQQAAASSVVNPLRQLLAVESRHLNPDHEMKRIFGSRVISSETRLGQPTAPVSHILSLVSLRVPRLFTYGTCLLGDELQMNPVGPLRECRPLVVLHTSILTPVCGRDQFLSVFFCICAKSCSLFSNFPLHLESALITKDDPDLAFLLYARYYN